MFNTDEIVINRFGDRNRVVEPGSVVTGVVNIEREGVDASLVIFWPTVSLKAVQS